jgi:uncharacterized coiled-coil DUF342 family protein
VAESSSDIKSSVSQMSNAMKELNDKSRSVQDNVVSVTQTVNDMGLAFIEEFNKINDIGEIMAALLGDLNKMTEQTSELRRVVTKGSLETVCSIIEELHSKMITIQTQFSDLQDGQIIPMAQAIEERKNLSREVLSDTLHMNNSISNVVDNITEINSNSSYINTCVNSVSSDIIESNSNLDKILNVANDMNEYAKQSAAKIGEFSLKFKKVEDAHNAINHTLIDAKNSMKTLNDLSANLRKVVDDLVRLDKIQMVEEFKP